MRWDKYRQFALTLTENYRPEGSVNIYIYIHIHIYKNHASIYTYIK